MARPDHSIRTPAIILKRRDFGEADRLLTILTPHHGKMDALAKGARKLTSQKMGHVELFTRADMLIHTGRDLSIVSQAEMTAPFEALRQDLTRGAYAAYCAELLDKFTSEGEAEIETTRLYKLFDATLSRLDQDADLGLATRYFEIHLLDLVGFRPELTQCVIGYEPVIAQDQVFSFVDGGVICPQHAPQHAYGSVPIPMHTLKLLRHLQRSSYESVHSLAIPAALIEDAERVMRGYLTHLLERRLQSVEFIHQLRREAIGIDH